MGKKNKIDIVIPAHSKDLPTLPYCVKNAKKYIQNVKRVIVISKTKLTDEAEWFDESKFPFQKKDVEKKVRNIIKEKGQFGIGWYYQQLLKLYALFVIPNISDNILVLDSDTVFYKKVDFMDSKGNFYFNKSREYKNPGTYGFCISSRKFIKKLIPEIDIDIIKSGERWASGIAHHMVFNKKVMKDLFKRVGKNHKNKEFWEIFLDTAKRKDSHCASEYDLYFLFMLNYYREKIKMRRLRYKNTTNISLGRYWFETLRRKYFYCSYHNRDYKKKD